MLAFRPESPSEVRQIVRQSVRQIVRQILNLLPCGVMAWPGGVQRRLSREALKRKPAARLKSANVIYIHTTHHHNPSLWATARPQAETRGALLLRGRLAVGTQKGRTRRPLSLRAHFPLSALRGSTGGRERKATALFKAMGVRNVPMPGGQRKALCAVVYPVKAHPQGKWLGLWSQRRSARRIPVGADSASSM